MISPASFRADLKAFADAIVYDDASINYWIAVANLMMGVSSSPGVSANASVATAIGSNLLTFAAVPPLVIVGQAVTDNSHPAAIPVGATVQSVSATQVGLTTNVLAPGVGIGDQIAFAPTPPAARKWGVGSSVATSPPTTLLDLGTELFVAHNLVLEKRSQDASGVGGNPGEVKGPTSSKSVGPVSISYDAASAAEEAGGYWNGTVYGTRFLRLARQKGMGPVQIGIGYVPPYSVGSFVGFFGSAGAWPGPYPFPQQGDSSFY